MEKKRKSVPQVLESLKAIRRRPIPREKIEEFNRIVEKERSRKIARSPEADL